MADVPVDERSDVMEALHGIAMDLPHASPRDSVPTEWGLIDKRVVTVWRELQRLVEMEQAATDYFSEVDRINELLATGYDEKIAALWEGDTVSPALDRLRTALEADTGGRDDDR